MKKLRLIVFGLVVVCCAASAQAQSYPDRPIKLIVSIAAGSVTDVIMRAAANELQATLGQPLVIENKGGAAGILGGQSCAQAAPDGYTVCIIYHSTLSFNPIIFNKLPYDADSDFVPIARVCKFDLVLAINGQILARTVAEFKDWLKQHPDKAAFGSPGVGSAPHLVGLSFGRAFGIDLTHVP